MLRNKPIAKYSGLTVILSNPSRFDNARLLTAGGGHCLGMFCLQPEYNLNMVDVRLVDDPSPFLPDTRCLLVCGETAMHKLFPFTVNNTLNEMRGSLFTYNCIPAICSYFPQDCADIKAYEAAYNMLSGDYTGDDSESGGDEDENDTKRHGATKRSNYAFWLRRDVWKCKEILAGRLPKKNYEPKYIINPHFSDVVAYLDNSRNTTLHFDIETDREEQNLQCFSVSNDWGRTCLSTPVLDYNYRLYHGSNTYTIYRALVAAIDKCQLVSHNGANFDFFVMGHKYRIPVNNCYDTMIAMHRCFPDVEKSLGHCVSYWTWERFHKDSDALDYRTEKQMMDRLKYCAKDVYTMALVHQEIEKYASTIPGLKHSIDTAMSTIVPYLTTTLQGIKVNDEERQKIVSENDKYMEQCIRIMEILVGDFGLVEVRKCVKNSKSSMLGSPRQCVEYFHNILGYPTVARSPKTGEPSLGKNAMYKLALKQSNPVIDVVLAYRAAQKEGGKANFEPWINNENNRTNAEITTVG